MGGHFMGKKEKIRNDLFSDLLSRQDYLVTQANDLAKSFGNLTTFEHKVLDYCFSFVQKEDRADKVYKTTAREIVTHFNLAISGQNYLRIVEAFKRLNDSTSIYLGIITEDGKRGIRMTSLFESVDLFEDGQIAFKFSSTVAPYIFQLKKNFYSFPLSDLAKVKSKYTLTLLKRWNAESKGIWRNTTDFSRHTNGFAPPAAKITGSLEEWEDWMLGTDKKGKPKRWPAGRFKQKALDVAMNELDILYPEIEKTLIKHVEGRRTVGFTVLIHSSK